MKFQNYTILNPYSKDCKDELTITGCSASTEFSESYACKKAFDGIEDFGWASLREGDGAWIRINLGNLYRIRKVMIRQRGGNERFKDVLLEFSVGGPVNFTLSNRQVWETIELDGNNIFSDHIKITGINVYNKINNGFAELKVFGCASGMVVHFE